MEINITRFFKEADHFEYSASCAGRGQNAGQETWANAKAEASRKPLLTTPEKLSAAEDFFRGFGAWSREELAAFSSEELNALLIQFVSGDIREAESLCPDSNGNVDWTEYQKLSERGTTSGRFYRGNDGEVYFSLCD